MLELVGGLAGLSVAKTFLEKIVGTKSTARTPEEPNVEQPADTVETHLEGATSGKIRRILARYDLRRITPGELLQLARELRDCGVLTEAEFSTLLRLKSALEQAGIAESHPVDLVQFCRQEAARRVPGVSPSGTSSSQVAGTPRPAELELVEKLLALAEW